MKPWIFQKNEVDIAFELGTATLDMTVEDLIRAYQKYNHDFGKFWTDHLVKKTKGMPIEERELTVAVAYDVDDSTRAVLKKKDIVHLKIKPESMFVSDLTFDHDDYAMLQGVLKYRHIPSNRKKFCKLETPSDCVDFILKYKVLK